ncbi:DNA alkylation repair protein [Gorillibacterium sp. CAU 1737]|uniref:DNA alkylation repair protein n=1 Tax=Gorillibacterium sp. CAU 1737 TaxID=3140362 RepID=UPI003261BB9C
MEIVDRLRELSSPKTLQSMIRIGINPDQALGVTLPLMRKLAKEVGRNHELALQLWNSGYHEARILATMVDNPREVTEQQLESWSGEFDSWDVCDLTCRNLIEKTPFAIEKAMEWSSRQEEFVKRAGFVLMARISVSHKKLPDSEFAPFFEQIIKHSEDDRNFVRKAMHWALRQIGKRNLPLNKKAVECAGELQRLGTKNSVWVANQALRELLSEPVQARLQIREEKKLQKETKQPLS